MSGDYYEYESGKWAVTTHAPFTGAIYENEHTMTDNNAYRFETSEKKICDLKIYASDHAALLGDSSNQRYPLSVDTELWIREVDISTLYIKNLVGGSNTKINIIGVEL